LSARPRVLVTGAAGRIGSAFLASEDARGFELVATDLRPAPDVAGHEVVALDVTDLDACRRACADVDAVLHLAADPDPLADFTTSVLPVNVLGTYNVLIAAEAAGVARLVWASSVWAVAGYGDGRVVLETDPARPGSDYGAGKVACEALCEAHATWSSTATVSVRIGTYGPTPPGPDASPRERRSWLSPRDANRLLALALLAETSGHEVVHGVSAHARPLLSIERTTALLGYVPADHSA
jgi:uronate dehydrogenase